MALIIGIDMGTSNSVVAVADDDCATRVLGPKDRPTLSSTVYRDGETFCVGRPPSGVSAAGFPAIKRLLGRKAHSVEVEKLARALPYRIAASPTGDCWVRVGDRPTPPQELAGALLRALRIRAEEELGVPVTRAVLAVPAYFDDAQRQAIRDAGQIAGLEVVRLINEPTAAALAYGMSGRASTFAVFDLGGGTFDVSILRVEDDVFTVLASHGDGSLGGDDWDRRIFDLLIDDIFSVHKFDATSDPSARSLLRAAAEGAKIELSDARNTLVELSLTTPAGETLAVSRRISRSEFEVETEDLCERLRGPCRLALADAGLQTGELDEVLLVGGMTLAPMIRAAVAEHLGTPTVGKVDPATAVAAGASVCAAILAGSDAPTTLLDVSAHSLSIRVGDIELPSVMARGGELPARRVVRLEIPAEIASELVVEIFRGESEDLAENTLVGRVVFNLEAAGTLELALSIDVNSLVSVTATEVSTGKTAQGRLRTPGALSQSQLVRLVGDGGAIQPHGD